MWVLINVLDNNSFPSLIFLSLYHVASKNLVKLCPLMRLRNLSSVPWPPLQLLSIFWNHVSYPLYTVGWFIISLRLSYCESGFIIDILLKGVAFECVHFWFGLETSDVRVVFRSLFCSLYLFLISIVDKFPFSIYYFPRLL